MQVILFKRKISELSESVIFFSMALQPLVGQGLLTIEASRSDSDTPQSVGLLWMSDQPDAENSTWQHTTLTTDRLPCPRLDSNPQYHEASGRRPTLLTARPLGSATFSTYRTQYHEYYILLINYFIPTNALRCFSVFCPYICFGTSCAIIRGVVGTENTKTV